MIPLKGKIFITGKIISKTGLHIGGTQSAMNIGEIDLNVIKSANGIPYIPGSSLKGKLRSLTAKTEGCQTIREDKQYIKEIYGHSGEEEDKGETLLIVRDAELLNASDLLRMDTEMDYTESKWENTIDRKTGSTVKGGLRQIERVPSGAIFKLDLVFSYFGNENFSMPEKWDRTTLDTNQKLLSENRKIEDEKLRTSLYIASVLKSLAMLQDDYLGGHGTRGYGKVEFSDLNIEYKSVQNYFNGDLNVDLKQLNIFDSLKK